MRLTLVFTALFCAWSSFAQTNSIIFAQLLSPTNSVLMTNADFRVISGNRIYFKNDAGFKSFHAADLNTNVLAALHVNAAQLDAKQAAMDAADLRYRQKYAAQLSMFRAQQAAQARSRAIFLQQNNPNASRYTGLNPDGSGQPDIDLMNYNATHGRTGWDGKQFNDNQSQGNFIGN